jgi:L-threonylcarbamoyladenylate synthase
MRTHILPAKARNVLAAARIIRRGGLVAFPTETVYGLGANALDPIAVRSIFRAKRRPIDNPLIIHISSARDIAKLTAAVPPAARKLARRFWPGPLTLVLPRRPEVPGEVSCGLPTIAIRLPNNPVACALIRSAGVPIAAPSANLAGRPSPTTAGHVLHDLAGRIGLILDGGPARVGVESTIVDCTKSPPVLLRPGGISLEQLRKAVPRIRVAKGSAAKPVCPGMKYRHYAPRAPLVIGPRTALIKLASEELIAGRKVGILAARAGYPREADLQVLGSSPVQWARKIFAALRELEKNDIILAESLPEQGIGRAVMNRLRKAASRVL